MKAEIFSEYGHCYDVIYQDKDYRGEAAYVARILGQLGVEDGSLLEFGTGTGRHARELLRIGYRVQGVERSLEMAARAGSEPGFSCIQADIRSLQLGKTFDAVLALFHVVSYQVENDDVVAVFRNARAHLERGGIFLFDVWYAPAVHAQRPVEREREFGDATNLVRRTATPDWDVNRNRVDVHYTIRVTDKATQRIKEFKEVHPMRYFSLPELDLLGQLTGFKRELAEEFMTGRPPSESTWGVCVALRAV